MNNQSSFTIQGKYHFLSLMIFLYLGFSGSPSSVLRQKVSVTPTSGLITILRLFLEGPKEWKRERSRIGYVGEKRMEREGGWGIVVRRRRLERCKGSLGKRSFVVVF